jgi:nitrogenase molybdenum-iron protein beta chain
MPNELNLAVKPVTPISRPDELRVLNWINSEEYKEKNFARQALVVNPAHACQPLGAELAAHGFAETLPYVHGSQGCASYYRSTFNRHFREPAPAVSSAMTEDAAVFGGQNNLHEGLENAVALYKPKLIAVFTSCMPEVIGDDISAFIKNARNKNVVPEGFPIAFANTPSFSGTHINGYDAMLLAILQTLTEGKAIKGRCTGKLNFIPGFDTNTADYREYKRYFDEFGIPYTFLADISESFDSPNDGTYRLYPGGTPLLEAGDSINGKATLSVGPFATTKTMTWIKENYAGQHSSMPMPLGIAKTDAFLMKLSELFEKPVPATLKAERGRAVDAMTDAQQYMHGKKFAIYGDPDLIIGYTSFLLEMGAIPYHIVCSRGSKKVERELQALLEASPFGKSSKIYMNRDLWHLRSLLMTDPVNAIIGDTHGKFMARDAKIPLFRFGFPVFDRVNLHRTPIVGYQGALRMLTEICNKFLDIKDSTSEDRLFEMMG